MSPDFPASSLGRVSLTGEVELLEGSAAADAADRHIQELANDRENRPHAMESYD